MKEEEGVGGPWASPLLGLKERGGWKTLGQSLIGVEGEGVELKIIWEIHSSLLYNTFQVWIAMVEGGGGGSQGGTENGKLDNL
jgi:hypothetical protein